MSLSRRFRPAAVVLVAALMAVGALVAPHVLAQSASGLDPAKLGMYVGFDRGERFAQFERELGTPIRYVVTMADSGSTSAMQSSVWGQFAKPDAYLPRVADRVEVVLSVPLAFGDGGMGRTEAGQNAIRQNLQATAAGHHDASYRLVAKHLKDAGYGDAIIRLGHEFDGPWAPYSARNNDDAYIAAFQHVHDVLASESSAFRFEWTSMRAHFIQYGPPAYPGDAYVDIIGLDIYWRERAEITDEQWNDRMKNVLVAHQAFALSKGKPVSYPEWGRAFADFSRFIDLMHDWFSSLPATGPGALLYHSYFNAPGSPDSYGPYNLDLLPNVKARYIELFGQQTTPVTAPPATAPPATAPPATAPPATAPPATAPPPTAPPPTAPPPTAPPPTAPPATAPPPTAPPATAPPATAPPRVAGPVAASGVLELSDADVCTIVGREVIDQVMGMESAPRTGALPENYGPSCIFTGNGGIGIQFHRYGPQVLANLATMQGKALTDVGVAGRRALVSEFSTASKQLIVWLGGDPDPALVVYSATLDGALSVAAAVLAQITD